MYQQQQPSEPFILHVENISSIARGFYLSQGLLYNRGAETAGQLRTGDFPAIGETFGRSLIASTSNSISIEQFIAFCQCYPTYIPLIQITSNNATSQLAQNLQYLKQGMIKNDIRYTVPFRKYANGDQYNLQFQNITEPIYICADQLVAIQVAPQSILTLEIYPLVSRDNEIELRNDIRMAKFITEGLPLPKMDDIQQIKCEAIASNLNVLLQKPGTNFSLLP